MNTCNISDDRSSGAVSELTCITVHSILSRQQGSFSPLVHVLLLFLVIGLAFAFGFDFLSLALIFLLLSSASSIPPCRRFWLRPRPRWSPARSNSSVRNCAIAVLLFAVLCGASLARASQTGSTIEFISVPFVGAGNTEKVSIIKGRVIGAQPGQRIVLYAKAEGKWWVQPQADAPFTEIQPGSRWQNFTHPGTDYAALLVGSDFKPPPTVHELPVQGVFASAITHGEPPIWTRWWFPFACVIVVALTVLGVFRLRLIQLTRKLHLRFEERLAERMRVAQELHDTLLQGVLSASMQLHVATDQLPADSPARPALNRVLQLMGQVIDEGRNTVRGLRSSGDRGHDLEGAFSRIPQEFSLGNQVNFRVLVEGAPLPLMPGIRDEIYHIGREALVNAFRHSCGNSIEVELEYAIHQLRIMVRDNGHGIDSQILHSGREGHWGLSGMRERAERIGARLKVWSRVDGGTEVELTVPGSIAFESYSPNPVSRWFGRFMHKIQADGDAPGGRLENERAQTNPRSLR